MSKVIVVGGSTGIGLLVVRKALLDSADEVIVFDRNLGMALAGMKLSYPSRLTAIEVQINKTLDWGLFFSDIDEVRSIVYVLPACKSRDLSTNDLGYTPQFSENISSVNLSLLELVATVKQKLIDPSSIVLVSSVLATRVAVQDASLDYHVSKAVLDSIMRYLAVKLAPRCSVNCVAPGLIARDESSALLRDEITSNRVRKSVPLGRPSSQEEVAKLLWSLCAGELPYVTGQTIIIDGGSSVLETYSVVRAD